MTGYRTPASRAEWRHHNLDAGEGDRTGGRGIGGSRFKRSAQSAGLILRYLFGR
jgi:hypothetical protein